MEGIETPIFTVVTVVKNHASGLILTLQSLSQQEFKNWESIVVVGDSQDSTLMVARKMAEAENRINVLEQLGLGIYSAMNQGLSIARGHIVCFMNAGDQFADPQILSEVLKEMENNNYDLIIGGHQVSSSGGIKEFSCSRKDISERKFAFNRRSGCHQSMFFRTQALLNVGGFDTRYLLASDFAAILKVIRNQKALKVPRIYSIIEPGGAADVGIFRVHQEKHQIRKQHFDNIVIRILSFGWTIAAGSKVMLRRLL